jgi:hypothetical protein
MEGRPSLAGSRRWKPALENVYRSFDYRDESVIYDSLERSVTGDLLTDTYLETRRSLELENQGGAWAKVKTVEMVESDHSPLTVQAVDGRWRISALDLIQEERKQ